MGFQRRFAFLTFVQKSIWCIAQGVHVATAQRVIVLQRGWPSKDTHAIRKILQSSRFVRAGHPDPPSLFFLNGGSKNVFMILLRDPDWLPPSAQHPHGLETIAVPLCCRVVIAKH